MVTTRTVATVAGVTAIGGIIAYAAYFDYKRRNDTAFRKKLKKEKKRVERSKPAAASAGKGHSMEEIKNALQIIRDEALPSSPEAREQYFMDNVAMGEQLCARGPAFEIPAALSFYRALRVYPSPVELIMIYQKTVPDSVFEIVMEMTKLDVSAPASTAPSASATDEVVEPKAAQSPSAPQDSVVESEDESEPGKPKSGPPSETSSHDWDEVTDPGSGTASVAEKPLKEKAEGYYDKFPEPSYNVSVKQVPLNDTTIVDGKPALKNILVAKKDFAPGEVIYKERPLVMALDSDLEGKGIHCSQCFRELEGIDAIHLSNDVLSPSYCSKECQDEAASQHHDILFGKGLDTSKPQIVSEDADDLLEQATKRIAQEKIVKYTERSGKSGLLLVARFFARLVGEETKKLANPEPAVEQMYTLYDHVERLKYLEIPESEWEDQQKLLADSFKQLHAGLDEFVKEDRYGTMLGKMAYNCIGVAFGSGRDGRPESQDRPEDRERTRTPFGTAQQVGSGLYLVSAYMSHSCDPTVRPVFSKGTNELHLVAEKPIKAGDELTMAYVNVTTPAGADVMECRRERRHEIARGWRFACPCQRCADEFAELKAAPESSKVEEDAVEEDVKIEGEGAKVEDFVIRFETGEAPPVPPAPAPPVEQDTE
ncbi:hypothetical protein FRC02_006580 [Tulasnella sp. 418]|nr:hypothetical protein FRC02_006580 [Tulasnella sp. 418]